MSASSSTPRHEYEPRCEMHRRAEPTSADLRSRGAVVGAPTLACFDTATSCESSLVSSTLRAAIRLGISLDELRQRKRLAPRDRAAAASLHDDPLRPTNSARSAGGNTRWCFEACATFQSQEYAEALTAQIRASVDYKEDELMNASCFLPHQARWLPSILLGLSLLLAPGLMAYPAFATDSTAPGAIDSVDEDAPVLPAPPAPPSPQVGKGEDPPSKLIDAFLQLVLAAALLGLSVATTFLLGNRARLSKLLAEKLDKLVGLELPAPADPDSTANYTMLIGLGGSGKTTLAKSLTSDPAARPNIKTTEWLTYSTRLESPASGSGGVHGKLACKLYVSDYPGQRLSELVKAFVAQQSAPESPLRFGYVTSAVLVVDVVSPPELHDQPHQRATAPEKKRIKQHLDSWDGQALDAVWGMLPLPGLQYACLFINKVNLLDSRGPDSDEEILALFRPLRERLSDLCEGVEVKTVMGSAEDHPTELRDDLIRNAIEPPRREGS